MTISIFDYGDFLLCRFFTMSIFLNSLSIKFPYNFWPDIWLNPSPRLSLLIMSALLNTNNESNLSLLMLKSRCIESPVIWFAWLHRIGFFVFTNGLVNWSFMFINFNDLPKGEKVQGGLTPFKIISTALKLKLQGYKPVICRPAKQERGWFVRKGDGGKSGEPLVRLNFGKSYSSFHAYDRKGKRRVASYVPIKSFLIQKKVA